MKKGIKQANDLKRSIACYDFEYNKTKLIDY